MKHEIEETVGKWQRDNLVRNLSAESMETYGSSAKDFLTFFAGRNITRFKQITDDLLNDYVVAQIERGCSARTINNRLKALRRLCNFYKSEVNTHFNVPNFKFQRETETARGPLTNEEVCRLIAHFDPADENSVLVAFILDTGLRSKSVRNIKVEHLDFESGQVIVRVTKNHDVLILPLSEALQELLKAYLNEYKIEDGYLFRNEDGGKMYDRSSVYKKVKKFLKSCGVKKKGVHLFRYTFGKIMIENNCNAMILQKWFGHRTMEETKKYVKLYSNELKNVCEDVTPLSKNGNLTKFRQNFLLEGLDKTNVGKI